MPLRTSSRPVLGTLTRALLATLVLGAPLALGGVHPATMAVAAAAAGTLLALHALERRRSGRRFLPGPLPWVMAAGAGWSLLQAVPLPAALLRVLSPGVAELYGVTRVLGPPPWTSLSAAPLATAVAAAQLATGAAVLAVGLDLGRQEPGRRFLLALAALAGGLVTAVGGLHAVLGWTHPFNHFPSSGQPLLVTTFVNANHAGAVMALGGLAALGLALATAEVPGRLRWAALGLASTLGALLCNSYGAVVGLLVGLLALGALAWPRRSERDVQRPAPVPWLPLGALALVVAGVVASAGAPEVFALWRDAGMSLDRKLALLQEALRPLGTYALTGMGRGAFLEVFPRHMELVLAETLAGPENILALLALEWGVPAAGLYLGTLLVLVGRGLPGRRDALASGALAAGLAVLVHNLVDFNLELLGVALPFLVLPGAAGLAPPAPETRRRGQGTAVGLLAGALLALLGPAPALLEREHGLAVSRREASRVPLEARAAALQAHLRWHPADYLATLGVARVLRATQPDNPALALAWVNRALFLRPTFAESQRDAARVLWDLGQRQQALLEYRAARGAETGFSYPLFKELLERGAAPEELRQVLGERDVAVCDHLAYAGLRGATQACLEGLARDFPEDGRLRLELATRALRGGDASRAAQWARDAQLTGAEPGAAAALLAQALDASGDSAGADVVLGQASAARASADVERLRLQRALATGALATARDAVRRLGPALEQAGQPVEEALVGEGLVEERAGQLPAALARLRAAASRYPANQDAVLGAARVALALNKPELAWTLLGEAYAATALPLYRQKQDEVRRKR